jgi:predicted Zn-dependent protease
MKMFALLILLMLAVEPAAVAQSFDVDKDLGKRGAEGVELSMGTYERPAINALLAQVGGRLVKGLGEQPFEYRFSIVDEVDPNAFALPGGYVYVSRGILALVNSEDELAGVIGHEIIHVHQRHAVKAAKRSILPGILSAPGALVGLANEEAGAILSAPSRLGMASYGRKQENEADEIGIAIAARAGYDPAQLQRCLARLSKAVEALTGEAERFSYFHDHPFTADRIKKLNEQSATLTVAKQAHVTKDGADFLRRMDGLVVGQNPHQGILYKDAFVHPDLNFRVNLPEGWRSFNTPTAFGAREPKGKAQVVFGLEEEAVAPEQAAKELLNQMDKGLKKKLVESKAVEVGSRSGYHLAFTEGKGKKATTLHLVWLKMDGKLFRIVGVGSDEYRETMRAALFSLRPLTGEERGAVRVMTLRLAQANGGETIEQLSARTQNAFTVDLTAVINDVERAVPLQAGQVVKIARMERYVPPRR